MTPAEALAEMRRRGVVLALDGGDLRARAPRGVITDRMHAYLTDHKPELLDLLRAEEETIAAKREASRRWAEEWGERRRIQSGDFGTVTCFRCRFEHNREIPECPQCSPLPTLPAGCHARFACSVFGPCEHACHDVSREAAS